MSILRPRSQDILPRWHQSVVLKGLMKPPFIRDGSDRNISLELLSYKTAFLIALATGYRGSELVALSRAEHNIKFSQLPSGAKHVSIRMVPKFIPKNAWRDTIPKPLELPGIAHLFGRETERLLCPVWTLGLYLKKSAELAKKDPTHEKKIGHRDCSPWASRDWAVTWAVIELWPSRDHTEDAVIELWPLRDWAVT